MDEGTLKDRPITSDALLAWMQEQGLSFELFEHEPLHSVGDSKHAQEAMDPKGHGVHIKNLFLRSAKKAQFLVTLEQDTKIDLKALGRYLGKGKLSFGSPERLWQALGVRPGAVTPLAMVHGREEGVSFYIERKVWDAPAVYMHPLLNTRTVRMENNDFHKFISILRIEVEHPDEMGENNPQLFAR